MRIVVLLPLWLVLALLPAVIVARLLSWTVVLSIRGLCVGVAHARRARQRW